MTSHGFAAVFLVAMLTLVPTAVGNDLADPGPFAVGQQQVTVVRPNGQTFTSLLFYPATQAGEDAPVDSSGAPYPAITFGHGFLQQPSNYESTLAHLASWGYFVIASESYTGFFPNHALFAEDLSHCLTWLEQQHELIGGAFEGLLDVGNYGASGHSMGGGASILATANDPRIRALANLAANETSTSAIDAMQNVNVPVSLIAGTDDSITDVQSNGQPMYDNGAPPKQLPLQLGAFHCGYLDFNVIFCDSGSMSRETQLELTRRDLTAFFNLYLKGDQSAWRSVWGPEAFSDPLVDRSTIDSGISLELSKDQIDVPLGNSGEVTVLVENTGVQATQYAIHIEDESTWNITAEPALTPTLAPDETATITLMIEPPAGAPEANVQPLISAQSQADFGTRAWGMLTIVSVEVDPIGDLNGDGVVNVFDLLLLLENWGTCTNPSDCPADLDGDGQVNVFDLLTLLENWG